jgi:hypothetical protein
MLRVLRGNGQAGFTIFAYRKEYDPVFGRTYGWAEDRQESYGSEELVGNAENTGVLFDKREAQYSSVAVYGLVFLGRK